MTLQADMQDSQIQTFEALYRQHPHSFRDQYNAWKLSQRQLPSNSSSEAGSALHDAYMRWREETHDQELEAFEPQALELSRRSSTSRHFFDAPSPPPQLPAPWIHGHAQPPPERTHYKPLKGAAKWVDAAFKVINGKAYPLNVSEEEMIEFDAPETEDVLREVR